MYENLEKECLQMSSHNLFFQKKDIYSDINTRERSFTNNFDLVLVYNMICIFWIIFLHTIVKLYSYLFGMNGMSVRENTKYTVST